MKLLQNKKIAYLTAIFCTLLWGTAFPFIKVGYSAFKIEESDIGSKLIFAGMRFMLAGFMVFLFLWISKRKPPTLSKKDILPVCSLGVVQTGLQYIFTYIGIGFTSGTNTSIITACASFFTVLFVPLFFKNDRLTLMKIIGCILGFGGIIAINFGGTVSTDTWFGDMMILFSTISAAAGNIVAKKVTTGRDPFPVTAFQLLTGGFILLVSGICCGGSIGLINVGYGLRSYQQRHFRCGQHFSNFMMQAEFPFSICLFPCSEQFCRGLCSVKMFSESKRSSRLF